MLELHQFIQVEVAVLENNSLIKTEIMESKISIFLKKIALCYLLFLLH